MSARIASAAWAATLPFVALATGFALGRFWRRIESARAEARWNACYTEQWEDFLRAISSARDEGAR